MKNLTLKTKLQLLLFIATLALLVVGVFGWRGITHIAGDLDEVANVRLPSIQGLDEIATGQSEVRSNARFAAFYELDYDAQDKFLKVLDARNQFLQNAERGWKKYEPLPQTDEEAILWKKFVQEWEAWKQSDAKVAEIILAMSKTREGITESDKAKSKDIIIQRQKALFVKYYQAMEETITPFS